MKLTQASVLILCAANLLGVTITQQLEVDRRIQAIQNYWKNLIASSASAAPTATTSKSAFTTPFPTPKPTSSSSSSSPATRLATFIEQSSSGACGIRTSNYLPHLPIDRGEPDRPRSRKGRIVWSDSGTMGTAPAPSGTFPWMASLFVLLRNSGEALFMCAGTILTPNMIVTAAHCFTNNDKEDTWFVRVGDNFILSPDKEEQTFRVKRILKHDDFDPLRTDRGSSAGGDGRHDIALVVLQPQKRAAKNFFGTAAKHGYIQFSDDVRPICMLPQSDYPMRKLFEHHCEIAGWGMTEYNNTGSYPDSVRAARILVGDVPDYYCNYLYRRDVRSTGKFCAGGTVDACQEDSGGPLVCRMNDGRYHLVGIVSSGKGCGVYPGLYTDVSRYMDWLAYWIQKESILQ